MNLRICLLIFATLVAGGCSILGSKLGSNVDKALGKDKYETQYAIEGLEVDIEIIKALVEKREKQVWDGPWTDPAKTYLCSEIPSCWNNRAPIVEEKLEPVSPSQNE